MTSIAVVNKTAPYGRANGQESLDFVLAAGSFGQDVSVFFIEDGVFQLLKEQSPEQIAHKNYSKTFAALEFYDVENIYVCQQSLEARGLTCDDLCIDAECIDMQSCMEKIAQTQHLLSF